MSDQQQKETVDRRRAIFDRVFEDYPDNAFDAISLKASRYVSVEDDPKGSVWVKGHPSLPAACRYLGDQMEGGYKPLFVLDLDTAEKVELTTKAIVVPQSMGAVVIAMSRSEADKIVSEGEMPESVARRVDRELNGAG